MKKLTGLILILLVIILGGSYATGVVVEKSLKDTIVLLDSNKELGAEITDYHRGWFTSNANTTWTIHVPEQAGEQGQPPVPAKDITIKLPLKVTHGPLIFADNTVMFGLGYAKSVMNLPDDYAKEFQKMFTDESQKPRVDMSIFVSYMNQSTINIDFPPFKAKTREGNITVDWKGLTNSSLVTGSMDKLSGEIVLNGFDVIRDTKDSLKVEKFEMEYDFSKTPSSLYVGSATINFPHLAVMKDGKNIFVLEKFYLESDSSITGNAFDAKLDVSLDKIGEDNITYGPGKLHFSMKNLDAEALARIHKKTMALDNNAQNQQVLMTVLPELPALLSKGPELEISEFTFKMPDGLIEGNLKISLPKEENLNPLTLIQKIAGEGKLSIPAPVLKSMLAQSNKQKMASTQPLQSAIVKEMENNSANTTDKTNTPEATTTVSTTNATAPDLDAQASTRADEQMAKMVQSGFAVINGSNYVTEFKLENGKLTINGKPFDKSMLEFQSM